MSFIIYQIVQNQDQYPTKKQKLASFKKSIKREETAYLHSRMKGILMASAEVYTSPLSHMNVNKC